MFKKVITILSFAAMGTLITACSDDSSSANDDFISAPEKDNSSSSVTVENVSSSKKEESSSSAKTDSSSSQDATSDSKDWRAYCLEVINKYRATEGLDPYALADDSKQTCTDQEAAADLAANSAHGHFGDCKEFGQNSAPNVAMSRYDNNEAIVDSYLKMMWDEKKLVESGERDPQKSEDFSYIGHYLNMSSTRFKIVSCGMAVSEDKTKGWMNVNFY